MISELLSVYNLPFMLIGALLGGAAIMLAFLLASPSGVSIGEEWEAYHSFEDVAAD